MKTLQIDSINQVPLMLSLFATYPGIVAYAISISSTVGTFTADDNGADALSSEVINGWASTSVPGACSSLGIVIVVP